MVPVIDSTVQFKNIPLLCVIQEVGLAKQKLLMFNDINLEIER